MIHFLLLKFIANQILRASQAMSVKATTSICLESADHRHYHKLAASTRHRRKDLIDDTMLSRKDLYRESIARPIIKEKLQDAA